MKLLTENEMLELIEAGAEDRLHLSARLRPVLDREDYAWFDSALKAGQLPGNVRAVCVGGRKVGALWYGVNKITGALVAKAGASFVPEDTTPAFMRAYELLAQRHGCTSIELQTARAGVAKIYQQNGFKITGLAMRKRL